MSFTSELLKGCLNPDSVTNENFCKELLSLYTQGQSQQNLFGPDVHKGPAAEGCKKP